MATKFSRYLLALAEIAAKIDLLTRKYLNFNRANARSFVKTLLGLLIRNSDPIYRVPRYDNKTNNNY